MKSYFDKKEIPMRTETNASYLDIPIIARSPSYQQPLEEACEQTYEAMMKKTPRYGH